MHRFAGSQRRKIQGHACLRVQLDPHGQHRLVIDHPRWTDPVGVHADASENSLDAHGGKGDQARRTLRSGGFDHRSEKGTEAPPDFFA